MRILFIGIHPDDAELGCGGTIALCCDQGHEVVIADLTRGESSSNGTPQERAAEAREAAVILGVTDRRNLELPDTGVAAEDPGQQRAVAELVRAVRPDMIALPNGDDPHPDHASGATLVARAVYLAGIAGYSPESEAWKVPVLLEYSGRREVQEDFVVDVTSTFERKKRAILAHASQFQRSRDSAATPLNDPDFMSAIEARNRAAGQLIGRRYGEPFRALTPIALGGLAGLLGGNGQ